MEQIQTLAGFWMLIFICMLVKTAEDKREYSDIMWLGGSALTCLWITVSLGLLIY